MCVCLSYLICTEFRAEVRSLGGEKIRSGNESCEKKMHVGFSSELPSKCCRILASPAAHMFYSLCLSFSRLTSTKNFHWK